MDLMTETPELIESPLSREELAMRYRELCEDPRFNNVPGKIELDVWGRIVMSPPPSNYHGAMQFTLGARLASLGGRCFVEASVVTGAGLFVADVAWASPDFMCAHGFQTPFTQAPEICVEVVSPSNSKPELAEKRQAYLATGAEEVWLVFTKSKRVEMHNKQGLIPTSRYPVDLAGIFE
jgi:Uma2 family endonuclease